MRIEQKRSALAEAAAVLDTQIYGLDATTPEAFKETALHMATRCDVLVAAGGDGTLSDIINLFDTARRPIAFLPLGTGNAMRYALNYKGRLRDIAIRIRDGKIYEYDLIECDAKRRAFTASIGIEGAVLGVRDKYLDRGSTGPKSYVLAFLNVLCKGYEEASAQITLDDEIFKVKNLLSLIVVKQPYYGFGMRVVPAAHFDDRRLHILSVNSGLIRSFVGVLTAFSIGNRIGTYRSGRQLNVRLNRPLMLQIDGNQAWESDSFTFTVLPRALKIKC
jgi:diacylglycerol kinase family enzyme